MSTGRGTWAAQSVKPPTLDFSSDHDLIVCEFKPHISREPAWDSLSPPSSLPFPAPLSLYIYIEKKNCQLGISTDYIENKTFTVGDELVNLEDKSYVLVPVSCEGQEVNKGKGVLQRIQWEGQDLTQGVSHVIFKFTLLFWGTWVAELVEHLTSTQVMISWFLGSSPALG